MDVEEYGRIAAAEADHWWYRNTRVLIRDLLEPWLRADQLVLDAGCGPGGNGAWLQQHGTVIGVDVSPEALQFVKSRHATRPVLGSISELPIAAETIDVALAITVLTSVPDDALAVRELRRVLRPGGAVVLFEPAFERLRRGHDRVVHSQRRYTRAQLVGLATAAGLRVHRSTYAYSFLMPPAAALAALDRLRTTADSTPGSDVERRTLDKLFAPLASVERRWARRHVVPFGTTIALVATHD